MGPLHVGPPVEPPGDPNLLDHERDTLRRQAACFPHQHVHERVFLGWKFVNDLLGVGASASNASGDKEIGNVHLECVGQAVKNREPGRLDLASFKGRDPTLAHIHPFRQLLLRETGSQPGRSHHVFDLSGWRRLTHRMNASSGIDSSECRE